MSGVRVSHRPPFLLLEMVELSDLAALCAIPLGTQRWCTWVLRCRERRVPIHPELLKEGLIKFVLGLPGPDNARIFPPRSQPNISECLRDEVQIKRPELAPPITAGVIYSRTSGGGSSMLPATTSLADPQGSPMLAMARAKRCSPALLRRCGRFHAFCDEARGTETTPRPQPRGCIRSIRTSPLGRR